MRKILIEKFGSLADAKIPSPTELAQYGIKGADRKRISKNLRDDQMRDIYTKAAEFLLARHAKRQHVQVECLKDVPENPALPDKEARGKNLKPETLKKYMESILKEKKQRNRQLNDKEIEALIATQLWPNLIVTDDPVKGKCVFTGQNKVFKDDIVLRLSR
jgi:hypothetical protein